MITKCRFKGKVCSTVKSGNTPSNAGGICGSNSADSAVIECINEGTVVGHFVRIGGIAGQNIGRIERCENTGKVYNYCSNPSRDLGEGGTGGIV